MNRAIHQVLFTLYVFLGIIKPVEVSLEVSD